MVSARENTVSPFHVFEIFFIRVSIRTLPQCKTPCRRAGGLRGVKEVKALQAEMTTLVASGPLRPSPISYSTFWPS